MASNYREITPSPLLPQIEIYHSLKPENLVLVRKSSLKTLWSEIYTCAEWGRYAHLKWQEWEKNPHIWMGSERVTIMAVPEGNTLLPEKQCGLNRSLEID